jgi:hypothetical protein
MLPKFINQLKIIIFIFCGGCALATTRPKLEMSMAAAAILAAKEVNANIVAPNLYRNAEVNYFKAKSSYRRKYFNKAKEYAEISKKFSEQAEYLAIQKNALEGTTAPPSETPAAPPAAPPAGP